MERDISTMIVEVLKFLDLAVLRDALPARPRNEATKLYVMLSFAYENGARGCCICDFTAYDAATRFELQ